MRNPNDPAPPLARFRVPEPGEELRARTLHAAREALATPSEPSGWLWLLLSLRACPVRSALALALVLAHVALFVVRRPDHEGNDAVHRALAERERITLTVAKETTLPRITEQTLLAEARAMEGGF